MSMVYAPTGRIEHEGRPALSRSGAERLGGPDGKGGIDAIQHRGPWRATQSLCGQGDARSCRRSPLGRHGAGDDGTSLRCRSWIIGRNLGQLLFPSPSEMVMLGVAWIDRPVDTQGLRSLLPRPSQRSMEARPCSSE
jgi:hypothetical protein